MDTLFALSVFLIFYAYFGYPLSLWVIGLFRSRDVRRGTIRPRVTLLITAFNEEAHIAQKLKNCLALEYPEDRLQILVASDGSTDKTNIIVEQHGALGVDLVTMAERKGKENAQKEALEYATGEIVVFSDVATRLEPDGVKQIVSNFADPTVGCVSTEDRLIDEDGKVSGEGLYVRYEMWLRRLETRISSLVGLSGSCFAARKDVCRDFSGKMQSDFRVLMSSVRMGFRGVADPKAVGYYLNILDEQREYERKVRTVLRGLTVFFNNLQLLDFRKYGIFSYQLLCHKLLRWLVPFFMILALLSNLYLAWGSPIYYLLLVLQAMFYFLGFAGMWSGARSCHWFMKIPMFFLTVNLSILTAWWSFFLGKRITMWQPSRR